VVVFGLGVWGCGGGAYSDGNDSVSLTAPTGPGVVTVTIVGINGALSFSPNPATLPTGQMIVWHNADAFTHRVVLNDGSLDTGNLDSGTYSQPKALNPTGGQYHCSIHPAMIGSVNQSTVTTVF
jgi:plastocyanin